MPVDQTAQHLGVRQEGVGRLGSQSPPPFDLAQDRSGCHIPIMGRLKAMRLTEEGQEDAAKVRVARALGVVLFSVL